MVQRFLWNRGRVIAPYVICVSQFPLTFIGIDGPQIQRWRLMKFGKSVGLYINECTLEVLRQSQSPGKLDNLDTTCCLDINTWMSTTIPQTGDLPAGYAPFRIQLSGQDKTFPARVLASDGTKLIEAPIDSTDPNQLWLIYEWGLGKAELLLIKSWLTPNREILSPCAIWALCPGTKSTSGESKFR